MRRYGCDDQDITNHVTASFIPRGGSVYARRNRAHRPTVARQMLMAALAMSAAACSGNDKPGAETHSAAQPIADRARGLNVDATVAESLAARQPALQPGTALPYDTVGEKITSAGVITPAMIRHGRELFHGRGAGASSCSTCHGNNGGGTATGPELRSGNFRDVTGDYQSIIEVVTVGVAQPKQFIGLVMPPMGGVRMTAADIRAVSAYVYTLAPKARRQRDQGVGRSVGHGE